MKRQCDKCPWKVTTDPREIPNGYTEEQHRSLEGTIVEGVPSLGGPLRIMGCHEHADSAEVPCVGWLHNQLGPGNNLGLRLRMIQEGSRMQYEIDGEQHERFEDTLPKGKSE